MERFSTLIDNEQERFATYQTYEELRLHWWRLSRDYPDHTRIELAGHGSDRDAKYPGGRPIEALILSNHKEEHKRPYALLQMEHENELPTTLAIQLLADVVCKNPELLDELGYNLILLNTTHPDGIALQEWTQADEFTPLSYALGFYRSAAEEQVAWGYPFRHKWAASYRATAENRASMRLIEHYQPTFLHSLHAAAIDDAHFFVNDATDTALMQKLITTFGRSGLRMQEGSPEISYYQKVDGHPGAYSPLPNAALEYDDTYKNAEPSEDIEWPWGTMASDYVTGMTGSARTLLTEVPYFTTDALRSTALSGMTLQDAMKQDRNNKVTNLRSISAHMTELDNRGELNGSPKTERLSRSLKWYCNLLEGIIAKPLEKEPHKKRELTVSEAYGIVQGWQYYGLLFRGEVHHLARRLGCQALAVDLRNEIEAEIEEIDKVSTLKVLPLQKLVGAQALSSLIALQHDSLRFNG
jgi:hypothetical protein